MTEQDLTECPYCKGPVVYVETTDERMSGHQVVDRSPRCVDSCEHSKRFSSSIAPLRR